MKIEIEAGGNKALWAVRLIWVVLALVVLGYLATLTEGNAVSVSDKPLLSIVALVGLLISYLALKELLVTREGTIPGEELLFLSKGRMISHLRLWAIRLLLAAWFFGTLTATVDSSSSPQSGSSNVYGFVITAFLLSLVIYWVALRLTSSQNPELIE